jgi:hypothetical protein
VKASEFDRRFDAGEDIGSNLDVESARRPVREARDVEVESTAAMLERDGSDLAVAGPEQSPEACH